MVPERDKRRMRLIAETMAKLNADAVKESAGRSPGENIEIGLRLGDAALAFARETPPRPPPVAPSAIWRKLKAAGRGSQR